jgi:hypothetical protein
MNDKPSDAAFKQAGIVLAAILTEMAAEREQRRQTDHEANSGSVSRNRSTEPVETERVEVGQHWAYRPRTTGPFHEVKIVAIGTKRPLKIRIEFVDDEREGERRWVSPARLEVAWEDVAAYRKADEALVRLYAVSQTTRTESDAATEIFGVYADLNDVASYNPWSKGSITTVTDINGLARMTGLPPEEMLGDPITVHDGTIVLLPWSSTVKVITALLAHNPSPIQKWLHDEQRQMQIESVLGSDVPAWVRGEAFHRSGEEMQKIFDERHVPVHNQIRAWMSASGPRQSNIAELQAELSRVGGIAQRAIAELKQLKSNRSADALLAELLDPFSDAKEETGQLVASQDRQSKYWAPPYTWIRADDSPSGDPVDWSR